MWMDKFERSMIMPSQPGPPQQSGLSLPLQHSIRCGATTNFNVKCLVYNCRQPTRIFSNWWHTDTIRVFPWILFGKPGNGKWKKSRSSRLTTSKNLFLPRVNSSLGKRYLKFIGPKLWSSIPDDIKFSTTFTFKWKLKKQFLHEKNSQLWTLATFPLSRTKYCVF